MNNLSLYWADSLQHLNLKNLRALFQSTQAPIASGENDFFFKYAIFDDY